MHVFRSIFVSFEFLFSLFVFVVYYYSPKTFSFTGEMLTSNNDIQKWVFLFPVGLCLIIYNMAWKLTTPNSDSNRVLYEWPGYYKLKIRRTISLVLSIVLAIFSILTWVYLSELPNQHIGLLFVIICGVSLINLSCIALAGFSLKELLNE